MALYHALYDSVAAHSRAGLNVVVDVGHHDAYAVSRGILFDCARRLAGLPAWLVGVRCPIEVIRERRRDTGRMPPPVSAAAAGDAPAPDPVERWQREVHIPGIYDLEVDTSAASPPECARRIREHLEHGPPPFAWERLADRG